MACRSWVSSISLGRSKLQPLMIQDYLGEKQSWGRCGERVWMSQESTLAQFCGYPEDPFCVRWPSSLLSVPQETPLIWPFSGVFLSVQFSRSVMGDPLRPRRLEHARPPCPSPTPWVCSNSYIHRVGDAMQPSHLLSSPSPPAFNLSQHQGLFQWVSLLHQVAKVLEFQLQHQSFQWILRTGFLMIDWFDLLVVQGTLKSLLQHWSSKASILHHSAFFIVQLLHPYMTTGKTVALTRWTFVSKIMSLLFDMLSRMVIAFLPRSKQLLISWLQSPSAVILEPKKIKSVTVFIDSPSLPWSNGTACHDLRFLNVEF